MININKLKEEQIKLAKKVILKDEFTEINTIAGVDQAFKDNDVISGIIVFDYNNFEVVEKKYSVVNAKIPYIPGYLSYRESPAIVEAFNKLEKKPDVLLVEGNGILHPRKIGMASHVGILLDQATIGVAKKLLLGEVKERKVYVDNEVRGFELPTREHSKPIYISPGHKINPKTSLKIVKKLIKFPHKLPEPLHLAHKYANWVKKEMG